MSSALLSSSLQTLRFATSARASSRRPQSVRQRAPICASHRSGFNANDAFRQAAQQWEQFQKQQQRNSAGQRGSSSKTDAFRGQYGPVAWNFDPEQVSKFLKEMDKAFGGDGSSVPSSDTMEEAATCMYFPADVQESATQYRYILDLPGVPKSDIKVQVDKDRKLIVSGERKKASLDSDWKQKKQERRHGAFQRKFQLPEDADVNKIQGKAENGVLTVTVTKVPKEDIASDSTSVPIY